MMKILRTVSVTRMEVHTNIEVHEMNGMVEWTLGVKFWMAEWVKNALRNHSPWVPLKWTMFKAFN